eukprot:7265590-Pyramimonas_sp.AAC.1
MRNPPGSAASWASSVTNASTVEATGSENREVLDHRGGTPELRSATSGQLGKTPSRSQVPLSRPLILALPPPLRALSLLLTKHRGSPSLAVAPAGGQCRGPGTAADT